MHSIIHYLFISSLIDYKFQYYKHVSKKNSGFQNFIFFQKKTAAHTLKQSDIDLFLHILAI
jgi:hypothetical protein